MDPILQQIYKTVIEAAPYVLAAYLLLWLGLMGFIALAVRRVGRLEKQLEVLEDSISRRGGSTV